VPPDRPNLKDTPGIPPYLIEAERRAMLALVIIRLDEVTTYARDAGLSPICLGHIAAAREHAAGAYRNALAGRTPR
jgi:hypothetical protein